MYTCLSVQEPVRFFSGKEIDMLGKKVKVINTFVQSNETLKQGETGEIIFVDDDYMPLHIRWDKAHTIMFNLHDPSSNTWWIGKENIHNLRYLNNKPVVL